MSDDDIVEGKYKILPDFPESRYKLKRSFKNAYQAYSSKELLGISGKTMLGKLFNENYANNYFSEKIQNNVIEYFSDPDLEDICKWVINKAKFSSSRDVSSLLGEYKYWRCFPREESQSVIGVRVGRLKLSMKDGIIIYQHESANAPVKGEWEDDGFAFFQGNRLYCLGFRTGNIRLLIAHMPDDISSEHLHGIVLSVQQKNHKIFSAAFAMFHQSNSKKFSITENDVTMEEFKKLGLAHPYWDEKLLLD